MPRQVGVLLPHVIHQPARRGDDDVDAGLERALLHAHLDAAVDRGARDRRVVRRGRGFRLRSAPPARASARAPARGSCAAWLRRLDGAVSTRRGQQPLQRRHDERAVLPVPVSAQAIRSLPASASGMTALWIGRVSLEAEIADAFEQPRVEVERRERNRRGVARRSARAPARATLADRGARARLRGRRRARPRRRCRGVAVECVLSVVFEFKLVSG